MIYLSRLILNPRTRGVLYDIGDVYELHRTVMRAFAEFDGDGPGRVLFRLDESRNGPPVLLVQSEAEPDWSFIEERRNYLNDVQDRHGNPAVRQWDPRFTRDQMLRFRLRANPVKRDNETRNRVGLYKEADQRTWLVRKAEQHGFAVDTGRIMVAPEGDVVAARRKPDRPPIHTFSVRYDGVLTVTNPERFTETLCSGIGPAKGLGFGLLSLAPAR